MSSKTDQNEVSLTQNALKLRTDRKSQRLPLGNAGSTKDVIWNSNINLPTRSSVETLCDKPSTSGDASKEILAPSVTRSEMFLDTIRPFPKVCQIPVTRRTSSRLGSTRILTDS
ncbi:hypothetical protein OUZ56_003334 [Daphnia magna]|uniref:Uncharacterized protein n=1 Tax=Daphnia magna TaxID=35525 RepID=A0ABR0A8E6_9CRUS|nr:hypothetical protein OUZ56_003334 [Daphnia magna]